MEKCASYRNMTCVFVLKSETAFWRDCCIIWRFHVLEKIHKNVKVTPSGSAPKEKQKTGKQTTYKQEDFTTIINGKEYTRENIGQILYDCYEVTFVKSKFKIFYSRHICFPDSIRKEP